MNDNIDKIKNIKLVRILQNNQLEIENCVINHINNTPNKLLNIKNDLNKIFIKNNITPNINIEYDKNNYTVIITLGNIGLKISISNDGYFY